MEPKAESKEEFFERSFEETEDGFYDERGFFTTPNGSFWDDERVYFNHLGFDKHGGTYDKYGIYLPGPNWNEEYNCYNDELDKNQDTDKAYSQVLDNINDELVEDYEENKRVLVAKEEDEEKEDELTEEQMKEIFEEAMSGIKEKKEEKKNVTVISVSKEEKSKKHEEVEANENKHENIV